ncbi:restriction endonuclease subunit S [Nostoc sp.]|uniref:restriction endonuclease subunit S n=1 Tax=Nostoc sp. TaxID=1180 RepID=UPI003592ED59
MKKKWNMVSLEQLGKITSSKRIFKSEYVDAGIPFYRTKEIKELANGRKISTELYISKDRFNEINRKFGAPAIGDLLITAIGTIGEIYVVDNTNFYFKDGNVLWLRDFRDIDPYFLKYSLMAFVDELNGISHGSAYQALPIEKLNKHKIPKPSLPEQKRIVAILDEAFEGIDRAIANTEKNLANSRELFESYLNAIFTQKGYGWLEKKLENICSIKHGFAFKGEFFTAEKSDYILLTPGSFYESGGYRDQGDKTKYYIGEIPDGFILKKGDFLFAMTEQAVGLLGSSLIVPESDKFLHNQRLGLVQVTDGFEWHNDFFFHQFNTQKFRSAVQSSASGVKVRHTSPKKLGAISVYFPPNIAEQKVCADTLNELYAETQRLETIFRQKIAALNELKQSILQKAFTGELTADTANQVTKAAKEGIAA